MDVRTLTQDAAVLWMEKRREGALLLVLIAVAATARKRYPRPLSDREAFVRFVADECKTITGMPYDIPVPVPGKGHVPLSEVLYRYVRCHLVHEGELPPTIQFTNPLQGVGMVIVYRDPLELPDGLVGTLAVAVECARENEQLFEFETKAWTSLRTELRTTQ